MNNDPGVALRSSTLEGALRRLEAGLGVRFVPVADEGDAASRIEAAASSSGLRSRRILLGAGWWRGLCAPMLAHVTDRRKVAREEDAMRAPEETGWVALVPKAFGGYRAIAGADNLSWEVDEDFAARLSPYAFTFHRTFGPRSVGARDVIALALGGDHRDLAAVVALGIVAALVGLLTPVATAHLIDRIIPAGLGGTIGVVIAGLAAAGLALVALEMLRDVAVLRLEGRTGVATQAAVLDRVITAPSRFFRAFSSGDLALRLGAVNAVQRSITGSAAGAIVAALFVVANLGLMFAYSPRLTLASLGVVAATVALSVAVGLARLKLGRRIEALDGRLGSLAFEYLAGIAKLRAAAAESRAFANWSRAYVERRDVNRSSAYLANFEAVVMTFLYPAATLLVLFLAWQLTLGESGAGISTGRFVAFHAALFALLGGVHAIVATALGLLDLKPLWERARPLLETLPENGAERGVRHDPRGAIALESVRFAYPGGPDVLHGIDLAIRPGEFVAIVGPSGSGKSTLVRLLLGFEEPSAGRIRFDGEDLATLNLGHLRRRIGTVLQGGKLWGGDLHTNIVGAANLPIEAAWEAARAAGIAEDIEAMPMGMYTMVGEGLSTLSGGQRQRVLIARALVGNPSILLLDEATSALDNLSQAAVLDGLERLEATRIVIAHRLGSVRSADRIVVLDAGRIVQEGTFAGLAAAPGLFRAMLERQS